MNDDGLHVLYVCRAVDSAAAVTATQVRWIATLAGLPQVAHVTVLTGRHGSTTLPPNVTVHTFAREPRLRQACSFAREVLRARPRSVSFFFVVQGGPYPALLLPFKLATRAPLYHWKAQPHVSRRMRFYARWCDDLVFTATARSLDADLDNLRVVGHGIDTERFRPGTRAPDRDFVTLGRVSPIKGVDAMIRAVAACRDRFGVTPTLDVVGPVFSKARAHHRELVELVDHLRLGEAVRFAGKVDHGALPGLLPRYRALLNFSATAFDKSVGEAMACGVPVLSTNPCVEEDLPADLREHCVVPSGDTGVHGEVLHRALSWDRATRARLGGRSREHVVQHHGLERLFRRILEEVDGDRARATPDGRRAGKATR